MAAIAEATERIDQLGALGVEGVEEPDLVKYEALVWSCKERREILARLYYSVAHERDHTTHRLLFIEPLT